jgi:hypothetical protein
MRIDDEHAEGSEAKYQIALGQARGLRTKGRSATLGVIAVGILALLCMAYAKYTTGSVHELFFRSHAGP